MWALGGTHLLGAMTTVVGDPERMVMALSDGGPDDVIALWDVSKGADGKGAPFSLNAGQVTGLYLRGNRAAIRCVCGCCAPKGCRVCWRAR